MLFFRLSMVPSSATAPQITCRAVQRVSALLVLCLGQEPELRGLRSRSRNESASNGGGGGNYWERHGRMRDDEARSCGASFTQR
jgi:hypothetical protein